MEHISQRHGSATILETCNDTFLFYSSVLNVLHCCFFFFNMMMIIHFKYNVLLFPKILSCINYRKHIVTLCTNNDIPVHAVQMVLLSLMYSSKYIVTNLKLGRKSTLMAF